MNINSYVCDFYFLGHISLYERFLAKRLVLDTASPAGHVGRGPGAIRVFGTAWQAFKKKNPAEVNKTTPLVSVQGALLSTYVPEKRCLFPSLGSHKLYIRCTADNTHISHRYNAAAHTPWVCGTLISAVLLWLVVFIGACRPYSTVCHIFFIRTYPS